MTLNTTLFQWNILPITLLRKGKAYILSVVGIIIIYSMQNLLLYRQTLVTFRTATVSKVVSIADLI